MSFAQSSIVATPDWGVRITITPSTYVITYRPSEFWVAADTLNDYVDVNHDGPFSYLEFFHDIYDHLEDLGRPELPFYSLSLQLPDASSIATIASVTPYISNHSHVHLPHYYVPSQNRPENSTDNTVHFDATYYYSGGVIPPMADLSSTYSYVGTSGVDLTINPFEYYPHHNEIIVPDSIQIVVKIQSKSSLLDMVNHYIEKDCYYDAVTFYDTYAGLDLKFEKQCLGDYVILTEKQYLNDLDAFVQHKTYWGYNVSMYDVDTENLTNEKEIRTFLYNLYQKDQKIRFLLLVGSLKKIPTSAGVDSIVNNPPTDIYYACLEEPTISDEPNLYPEIYVGRWLVNNSYELNCTMKKTMTSENVFRYTTLCDAELFSGDSTGTRQFNRNVNWISNKVLSVMSYPNTYHLGSSFSSPLNAKLRMQTRIHNDTTWLFYYRGHGGRYTIDPPYDMQIYDFSLNSYAYLGFAFACRLGDVYHNCFAKEWLCYNGKGGPIYYASTTSSDRSCNNNHSKRVFKMLKKNVNMHIAQMTVGGSNKYYGSLRSSSERRNQIKRYMLYGDPSLFIWGQESTAPYRSPQRNNDTNTTNDDAIEYVYDINGRLFGVGNGSDIMQSVPNGIYIIYNSNENSYTKIVK